MPTPLTLAQITRNEKVAKRMVDAVMATKQQKASASIYQHQGESASAIESRNSAFGWGGWSSGQKDRDQGEDENFETRSFQVDTVKEAEESEAQKKELYDSFLAKFQREQPGYKYLLDIGFSWWLGTFGLQAFLGVADALGGDLSPSGERYYDALAANAWGRLVMPVIDRTFALEEPLREDYVDFIARGIGFAAASLLMEFIFWAEEFLPIPSQHLFLWRSAAVAALAGIVESILLKVGLHVWIASKIGCESRYVETDNSAKPVPFCTRKEVLRKLWEGFEGLILSLGAASVLGDLGSHPKGLMISVLTWAGVYLNSYVIPGIIVPCLQPITELKDFEPLPQRILALLLIGGIGVGLDAIPAIKDASDPHPLWPVVWKGVVGTVAAQVAEKGIQAAALCCRERFFTSADQRKVGFESLNAPLLSEEDLAEEKANTLLWCCPRRRH